MKIQGLNIPNSLKITDFEKILSKLNIGDKITAQVISVNNNEVVLKLSNNEIINATTTFPFDVNIGDSIHLVLNEKSDTQIILQTVFASEHNTNQKEIENTLLSLKISPDDRNIQIARELIEQNIPLNKENFIKIVNTISKFNIDIEKAVFMMANNLTEIQSGIETLNNMNLNNNNMSNLLNNLSNQLSSLDNTAINQIIEQYEIHTLIENIKNENSTLMNLISNYSKSDENINDIVKSILSQSINLSKIYNTENQVNNNILENQVNNSILENQVNNNISGSQVNNNISENRVNNIISENHLEQIFHNIDKNFENNELTNFIKSNPEIKTKILEFVKSELLYNKFILEYENDNINFKELKNYDTKDKLNKFIDILTFSDKESIESKINVNKLFSGLLTKLDIIEQNVVNGNLPNSDSILSTILQIKNTINLTSNINNSFYYFQIPVVLKDKPSCIELYIAKNKKKANKIDPNNSSLFISLNTQNLGTIESFININYKNVNFNFRLEDKETLEYIKKNQNILVELIKSKGYYASKIEYSVATSKTNLLNFNKNVFKQYKKSTRFDYKI